MLRSLRDRLIFTHILPILVIVPLTGIALFYVLETRFLLPRLAEELQQDARLLAEISRSEGQPWGNPLVFELLLSRLQIDPSIRVMFLGHNGQLLYSSDPADQRRLGSLIEHRGLFDAQLGEESVLTNYSILRLQDALIDVFTPVSNDQGEVVGVVRVSYLSTAIYELFSQLRNLIAFVLVLGLVLGAMLGLLLAINLATPLQRVTRTVDSLARRGETELLPERGPQEIRELTRAVNVLVERLQSLEVSRRTLLANIVHELGRPLGALRSAIQALSKGAGQDPQLLADLTTGMDEEAIFMQRTLEDLARLHDQIVGRLELEHQTIALGEWLPRVLSPWQQAAREKRLEWQEAIPNDLPAISADPLRLAQVVGNLVDNAIRYTAPGGTVRLAAGEKDGSVWFEVADTGPGIPVEEQSLIFNPFYRGDQGRTIKQGMGLGLSIAHDLAVAHGGSITVESAPGSGSRFTLWLPKNIEEDTT